MENLDEKTKEILKLANARRAQLVMDKENLNLSCTKELHEDDDIHSPRKVLGSVQSDPSNGPNEIRARFAALAEANADFQDEYQSPRHKTSDGNSSSSQRRSSYFQSVISSSARKRSPTFTPKELPVIRRVELNKDNAQDNTNSKTSVNEISTHEYGLHTFVTKKSTPTENSPLQKNLSTGGPRESSSEYDHCVISTKGQEFTLSPIIFAPKSTSSPINENLTHRTVHIHVDNFNGLPKASKTDILNFSSTLAALSDSKSCTSSPNSKAVSTLHSETDKPISKSEVISETKPRASFHTLWRGSSGTPVIQGANSKETDKLDIPRKADIKSLRNRWEFSSTTGTPLHPDATEDELLKSAIHMSQTSIPIKKSSVKKLPFLTATPKNSYFSLYKAMDDEAAIITSAEKTPHPSHENRNLPELSQEFPEIGPNQEGEVIEEDDLNDSYSRNDNEEFMDGIKAIDAAFDFIKTPQKQSQTSLSQGKPCITEGRLAPLATHEVSINTSPEKVAQNLFVNTFSSTSMQLPSQENKVQCDADSTLAHSISFYRKQRNAKEDENIDKIIYAGAQTPTLRQKVIQAESCEERCKREESIARIQQAISVEDERLMQATRALAYCRQNEQFTGGREEIDAARAVLIARETRNVLLSEIERIENIKSRTLEGPKGSLQISQLRLFFNDIFVDGMKLHYGDVDIRYFFIVLIKCEGNLLHSPIFSNEAGILEDGSIELNQFLQISNIRPDFNCILEVYAMRWKKRNVPFEDTHYYPKKGTFGFAKKHKQSTVNKPEVDPGFDLVGKLVLDINNTDRRKFQLVNPVHPLSGSINMKIRRCALTKHEAVHRGFLSLYQITQGLAAWTRYWCVLEKGQMKFWRSPDDENTKNWVVLIDLATCTREGAVIQPHGNYPNSFYIDVWAPRNAAGVTPRDMEKLRVLMAADHKEMLIEWIEILNKTIHNLLLWNIPDY